VERLLELAALEARREAPPRVNVDVSRVVADTVGEAETVATTRKITLHLAAAEAVLVTGDKFLLEQAVSNLLQNALQFTPGGGAVTVSVTSTGDRALVKVEDSGPGVPAYALEKVFERFYSLPRPDTGRKSSGLGLSIVREIARLHGGEVSLENRPEGGACALLSLPLVTAKIA
jgi:two-component system, OmpR family, sensor histidine kinase CreC